MHFFKEKDYSSLRKMSTDVLCEMYYQSLYGKHLSKKTKEKMMAILYIVGEKEIVRYLTVVKTKEVKKEEFEIWYANDPRELKISDIKATLELKW